MDEEIFSYYGLHFGNRQLRTQQGQSLPAEVFFLRSAVSTWRSPCDTFRHTLVFPLDSLKVWGRMVRKWCERAKSLWRYACSRFSCKGVDKIQQTVDGATRGADGIVGCLGQRAAEP